MVMRKGLGIDRTRPPLTNATRKLASTRITSSLIESWTLSGHCEPYRLRNGKPNMKNISIVLPTTKKVKLVCKALDALIGAFIAGRKTLANPRLI
jgi:hypothetical protein